MCKNTHLLVKPLEEAHFMGDSDFAHHEALLFLFLHSKMPTSKTRQKKKSSEDKRMLLEKMKFPIMKIKLLKQVKVFYKFKQVFNKLKPAV